MGIEPVKVEWDDGNRAKCAKHGVSIAEVEYVLSHTETLIVPDIRHSLFEHRLIAIGRVPSGRFAFVVFTPREYRQERVVRPISARYMHEREIRKYEKEISRSQDG